jgi:hypothetical protein
MWRNFQILNTPKKGDATVFDIISFHSEKEEEE